MLSKIQYHIIKYHKKELPFHNDWKIIIWIEYIPYDRTNDVHDNIPKKDRANISRRDMLLSSFAKLNAETI